MTGDCFTRMYLDRRRANALECAPRRSTSSAETAPIALDANLRALGSLRPPVPRRDGDAPLAAVERLFAALVCSAGNQVLWAAYRKVSGQLDLIRRVEGVLFDDLGDEAAALYAAYADETASGFAAALDRYHERRIGAAGALVALLLGGEQPGSRVGVACEGGDD